MLIASLPGLTRYLALNSGAKTVRASPSIELLSTASLTMSSSLLALSSWPTSRVSSRLRRPTPPRHLSDPPPIRLQLAYLGQPHQRSDQPPRRHPVRAHPSSPRSSLFHTLTATCSACRGTISLESGGKSYKLKPDPAVLLVRYVTDACISIFCRAHLGLLLRPDLEAGT